MLLEDGRLSSDADTGRDEKVVMWSYAVVKDGLIYVVDLRNGLYVLQYRGPHRGEVEPDPLPGRQLQPGRRALLRPGRGASAQLPLT